MDRSPLSLPSDLSDALDRAVAAGSPDALRHLAVWAARQVPVREPWTYLVTLAEEAAAGRASTDALATLHRERSGAACAATVCGLSRGVAGAAAALAAFHAAHPDPQQAARGAVQSAHGWHVLSPEGDATSFVAQATAEVEHLANTHPR